MIIESVEEVLKHWGAVGEDIDREAVGRAVAIDVIAGLNLARIEVVQREGWSPTDPDDVC